MAFVSLDLTRTDLTLPQKKTQKKIYGQTCRPVLRNLFKGNLISYPYIVSHRSEGSSIYTHPHWCTLSHRTHVPHTKTHPYASLRLQRNCVRVRPDRIWQDVFDVSERLHGGGRGCEYIMYVVCDQAWALLCACAINSRFFNSLS